MFISWDLLKKIVLEKETKPILELEGKTSGKQMI